MARYSEQTIADVNREADIREMIEGADTTKAKQYIDCPFCGAKKKFSITRNSRYNCAKCFSCGEGYSNPISAWMHLQNYSREQYPQAIEEVAKMAHLNIRSEEDVRHDRERDEASRVNGTFCATQLAESGLKVEDVMATLNDGKGEQPMSPFQPGSFGPGFRIDPKGSDMMIYYLDLYGRPMTYMQKGSTVPRRYARVRYANPDLHRVKDKAMKYQTPTGASSRAYIPEYIRRRFLDKEQFDTLFLQEGEKKAEKACKHGMPSIGIQGINNIGAVETGMIQDIQEVVRVCGVRNVVLMMDSDWDDLHRDITVGDRVDKRPNSFAAAVIKFKQFMASFHNLGIDVEAWWGHVNKDNDFGDKGIDDLLLNTLKMREGELMEDAVTAMNTSHGKGRYVSIVKISTVTDMKIRDYWCLNDHQAFYERHRRRLEEIPTFRLGGIRYKVEEGKMLAMSRYSSNSDIYSVTINDKEEKKVSLNYEETFRFLSDSGFKIYLDPDSKTNDYEFVYIDDGIIETTSDFHIRNFVCDYIKSTAKDTVVREYFISKIDVLLNEKKLQRLEVVKGLMGKPEALKSDMYFNNGKVEITSSDIAPELVISNVWRDNIVPRRFKRIPVIRDIKKTENGFTVDVTDMGSKCDFLQFLLNTSNNFYKAGEERDFTAEEEREVAQHFVNKITSLGYLMSEWKPDGERKAVIVQDHLMSEVGQNNGGAGKSLIADAVSRIVSQEFILGSKYDPGDKFVFDGVSRNTRNVFLDDVKPNFDFKSIYPLVTGDFIIDRKNMGKLNIPAEMSPKILITTNHTINSSTEAASKRRIIYMEFSSWYNPDHTPYNDFGHYFFSEWDELQWMLFDNLMAECVMYYFRSYENGWAGEGVGAVPPPMQQIELRSLRQFMSEVFYQWAEEYYDPSGEHLNKREARTDVFGNFIQYAGDSRHGVTRSNISKKIKAYCEFKGYAFNPDKQNERGQFYCDWKPKTPTEVFIGGMDKSGGKEFFEVFSPDKAKETASTDIASLFPPA